MKSITINGWMEMKNRIVKIIISLAVTILFISLSVIMVNAQFLKTNNPSIINISENQKTLDMLIFISPQYNKDVEIILAINSYTQRQPHKYEGLALKLPRTILMNAFPTNLLLLAQSY